MPGRNSAREHASPRVSRSQKKVSETVQIKEQKVTEIIASARKQRLGKLKPSSYQVRSRLWKSFFIQFGLSLLVLHYS